MASAVEDIINDNPAITLVGISDELRHRLPQKPSISRTTIARICDGLLISIKKLQRCPADRNREDVKSARRDYARWFLEEGQLSSNIVYIDESGFNLWTQRTRGRAHVGERAIRVVGAQRGGNLTVIMAISPQLGLINAQFINGGTTKVVYQQFLDSLIEKLEGSSVLVMDNAPCHKGCNSPFPIKYLPAYSPFLNPIENAFSSWKAVVKRELARPETQIRIADREAAAACGQSLLTWRRDILREVGEFALETVSVEKCLAWHRHCLTYFPRCQDMTDIHF